MIDNNGGDMHWSNVRTPRSVNALRLWNGNPRLEEDQDFYVSVRQIIKEIFETAEFEFVNLMKSIAENEWLYFDTIVVVRNERDEFYVVEGNRRIAALKLFHNYKLAPKDKWPTVKRLASKVNVSEIEKVLVSVAPSFKDAMFYITQRHTTTPIDKWKHEAQLRWIIYVLDLCNGDIEEACKSTGYTPSEFKKALKVTQIHDYAKQLTTLTEQEREFVSSQHEFPLTTLIRVISFSSGKQFLQLQIDESSGGFLSSTTKEEFDSALTFIIREINEKRINSRSISKDEDLKKYIEENYRKEIEWPKYSGENTSIAKWSDAGNDADSDTPPKPLPPRPPIPPNRTPPLVAKYRIPSDIELISDNERLKGIFHELKSISYNSKPNSFGVLLRVFLDIAISDYIHSVESLSEKLKSKAKGDFKKLSSLQYRITFLQEELGKDIPEQTKRAIEKFLNYKNIVSLDTLNFYVHCDMILPTKEDLKNQWNMISDFTKCILEYK